MKYISLKSAAVLLLVTTLLVFVAPCLASPVLLQPPGNGVPFLSKDKPVKKLNDEMIAVLADGNSYVSVQNGVQLKKSSKEKLYQSSYALPDRSFDLFCTLSVEQGSIQIIAGNIYFVVYPEHIEIYQDGKLIKSYKSKSIQFKELDLREAIVLKTA